MKTKGFITLLKIWLILFCCSINVSLAQNVQDCEKVVALTVEALNAADPEIILPYLHDDFNIMAHQGDIAKQIFAQMITQLGKVNSFVLTNQIPTDNQLTLNYSFDYAKMGQQNTSFSFDDNNKLVSAELAKVMVKTISQQETVVQRSQQNVITIPFRLAGKLILVDDVMIDGEKKTFVFDSGCPVILLNQQVENQSLSSAKGVGGNISHMDIQKVDHFDWNGIQLTDQDVLVADISHLENETKEKIHGLIGFIAVKDYDILYDYQNQKIILINPEKFDDFQQEYLSNNKPIKVPLQMANHIPVVQVDINGLQLPMGIDCGATQNLIDTQYLPQLKKQLKHRKKAQIVGADKNITHSTTGQLKKMTLGDKSFTNTATTFGTLPDPGSTVKYEGLIGYEILSKQKTLVSFARKEVIFFE